MDWMRCMKTPSLLVLSVVLLAGCQELDLRLQSPDEKAKENANEAIRGEKDHSALIGDYIQVAGLNTVALDGVGLVTNLNGTGDDPPASVYRTALLDDMRKRNIPDPNQILRDPSTTLVLVRAYLPPLIKKSDTFDVEVYMPDGSEATSLKGGMLLECELTEQAYVAGRGTLKGHRMAIAHGAILTQGEDANGVRRGVIPAGATYVGDDRNLSIYLRPDYKSVRMSQRIAQRIGQRFHDYDEYGIKRPLAEAKTDSRIELIVHTRYRDNYPRYLHCIRHILLRDTTVERHLRMQQLEEDLLVGPTAEKAALELEAIGTEAIPILKRGLESDVLEVRFHAAQALAYLGQSEAAPALREAAAVEPAFRVFALAGLAALHTGEAASELQTLLDADSMETRYGAVRALSNIDTNDPAIDAEVADQGFVLRVVDSRGTPMVHLTKRQKAEVTIFGAQQEFEAPLVASAGRRFLVKRDPGRATVTISHFSAGRDVHRTEVSARVADVIRELARQNATYPDIVQLLVEADQQHNLTAAIGVDVLPQIGRVYTRPQALLAEGEAAESPVGGGMPNLFGGLPDKPDESTDELSLEIEEEETPPPSAGNEQTSLNDAQPATGPVDFTVQ
jgi:hypothetical protein